MKNLILSVLLVVAFAGIAFADVVVYHDSTRVNNADKVNFKNGPTVTANGTKTDVDFEHITISPVRKTSNPCATLGTGTIFFNNSTSVPCYCNGSNDYAIYSATVRCF